MADKQFLFALKFFTKIGGITLALFFLLSGCATNGGRYDSSCPADQECLLILDGGGEYDMRTRIVKFDETPVNWRPRIEGVGKLFKRAGAFHVKIPSGEHTLAGEPAAPGLGALASNAATQYSVTYNFVAGHTYKAEVAYRSLQISDITK